MVNMIRQQLPLEELQQDVTRLNKFPHVSLDAAPNTLQGLRQARGAQEAGEALACMLPTSRAGNLPLSLPLSLSLSRPPSLSGQTKARPKATPGGAYRQTSSGRFHQQRTSAAWHGRVAHTSHSQPIRAHVSTRGKGTQEHQARALLLNCEVLERSCEPAALLLAIECVLYRMCSLTLATTEES